VFLNQSKLAVSAFNLRWQCPHPIIHSCPKTIDKNIRAADTASSHSSLLTAHYFKSAAGGTAISHFSFLISNSFRAHSRLAFSRRM
jgi:hypothetical protein